MVSKRLLWASFDRKSSEINTVFDRLIALKSTYKDTAFDFYTRGTDRCYLAINVPNGVLEYDFIAIISPDAGTFNPLVKILLNDPSGATLDTAMGMQFVEYSEQNLGGL